MVARAEALQQYPILADFDQDCPSSEKQVVASHFEAMAWYTISSVPVEEIAGCLQQLLTARDSAVAAQP
jgi:hypothetical protein